MKTKCPYTYPHKSRKAIMSQKRLKDLSKTPKYRYFYNGSGSLKKVDVVTGSTYFLNTSSNRWNPSYYTWMDFLAGNLGGFQEVTEKELVLLI